MKWLHQIRRDFIIQLGVPYISPVFIDNNELVTIRMKTYVSIVYSHLKTMPDVAYCFIGSDTLIRMRFTLNNSNRRVSVYSSLIRYNYDVSDCVYDAKFDVYEIPNSTPDL